MFDRCLFKGKSIDVQFIRGCNISDPDQSGFAAAIELAKSADVVIYVGGLDQSVERETADRVSIAMPDVQLALIQQLEKVARSPLHIVIMSGSGLDLSYVRDSPQTGSLIWMGYASQSGGTAIASVLFGQYNPGGRLPFTMYPAAYVNTVSMFDMGMRPSSKNPGRTYKFYTGQAVFEFGSGLSYTTFVYSWNNDAEKSSHSILSLMNKNTHDERALVQSFRVNVTNTGNMAGDDVVLAFIKSSNTTINEQMAPLKQLFGFQRINLAVQQTKEVFFPLFIRDLLAVAADGSKWLHPGSYKILIGKQHTHTIQLFGPSTRWASPLRAHP